MVSNIPCVRRVFTKLHFHVRTAAFFRIGARRTRQLLRRVVSRLGLANARAVVSTCYNINALALPLTGTTGHYVNLRIRARTIRRNLTGTKLGNVSGIRFQTKSINRALAGTTRKLTSPLSVIILSPPHGNYSHTILSTLVTLGPSHVTCVDYSPTALTHSLRVLHSRNNCALAGIRPTSFFPRASRIRYITFLMTWEPNFHSSLTTLALGPTPLKLLYVGVSTLAPPTLLLPKEKTKNGNY